MGFRQPPGWWFEIIRGLVNEQKDQAIARDLGISYKTLRTQLSRLYRKLGLQTRTGVVVCAFETFIRMRLPPEAPPPPEMEPDAQVQEPSQANPS